MKADLGSRFRVLQGSQVVDRFLGKHPRPFIFQTVSMQIRAGCDLYASDPVDPYGTLRL